LSYGCNRNSECGIKVEPNSNFKENFARRFELPLSARAANSPSDRWFTRPGPWGFPRGSPRHAGDSASFSACVIVAEASGPVSPLGGRSICRGPRFRRWLLCPSQ